jgi:phosphatidylinositol glycan class W
VSWLHYVGLPIQIFTQVAEIDVLQAQQIALSFMGMGNFVLTAPRTNILSANKEGIVSLGGKSYLFVIGTDFIR